MLHGLAPCEVWFDIEVLWFNEKPRPALAFAGPVPAAAGRSRSRTALSHRGYDGRRSGTSGVPAARGAAALVVGSTAVIPLAVHRYGRGCQRGTTTHRGSAEPELPPRPRGKPHRERLPPSPPAQKPRGLARSDAEIDWRAGISRGLPFGGSLVDGTQLPGRGAELGHVEPGHGQRPERAEAPVRQRAHDPRGRRGDRRVPRREPGGAARRRRRHQPRGRRADADEHVSHQNGLDVDIYYPRLDRALRAPVAPTRSTAGSRRISSTASSPRARRWSSSATRPASTARRES